MTAKGNEADKEAKADLLRVSVVIPVRDHWQTLSGTLCSLEQQKRQPMEIIVIDDGSKVQIPSWLYRTIKKSRLTVVRQTPLGIAEARNRGMAAAIGDIVLFTDSDCILQEACLLELIKCATEHPEDVAFQLAFMPKGERAVWRADGIAKYAKQQVLKTHTGHIMYLDTGAFAIRRDFIMQSKLYFDPAYIRGSDTGLLQKLISVKIIPRFANNAKVEHRPAQSVQKYIFRQFINGYYDSPARAALFATSVDIHLKIYGRIDVLRQAWRAMRHFKMGLTSFLILIASYFSELGGRFFYSITGIHQGRNKEKKFFKTT